MKPGKNDKAYRIRFQGEELEALKEVCIDLPESYGLDRRIQAYQGARAISFYAWDLDCLIDTFEDELSPRGQRTGIFQRKCDPKVVQRVYERLSELYSQANKDRGIKAAA